MKALVRKELVELGVSFVPILIATCAIWLATCQVEDVLVEPSEPRMTAVFSVAAGAGLLFAFTQLEGERIRGTWGFLVHRGAGLDGCFRIKAWIGVAASILLGVVPPLVFAVVHTTIYGEARVIHWYRIAEYLAIATVGASTYALAAFAFCLRRGFLSETLLAVAATAGWLLLSLRLPIFAAGRLAAR
jgi:hypothetical protein